MGSEGIDGVAAEAVRAPSSSLLLSSLELSDTKVYEPGIRALLGAVSHFCEVVVLELRPKRCVQGPYTQRIWVLGKLKTKKPQTLNPEL